MAKHLTYTQVNRYHQYVSNVPMGDQFPPPYYVGAPMRVSSKPPCRLCEATRKAFTHAIHINRRS